MILPPRQYIAIDLKSFYASVECVERGLDPLDACLVVADETRTSKTICLAVSPALKSFGLGGRPRLFEVERQVRMVNRGRGCRGMSMSGRELALHTDLAIGYVVASPRMALYLDYSSRIYSIYLRHVAPEDIHVYSVDEVFIDVTPYLPLSGLSAHEFAMMLIREVLSETGITATAGIGSNLYLCKVAMDIVAKKMPPDSDGVRIAELDEMSYRRILWNHTPLTDFWRVGPGIARRLARYGLLTMGDVARCSLGGESLLYGLLGVNAELLIDHAWGWEPVTMPQIKAYRPASKSKGCGQVLQSPYTADRARVVALEMADSLSLTLLDHGRVADHITLTVGYDAESLRDPVKRGLYDGPIHVDRYGREVPVHAHGTSPLGCFTSSEQVFSAVVGELYDRIVNPELLVRRLTLTACNVRSECEMPEPETVWQPDLFSDHEAQHIREEDEKISRERERRRRQAVLEIKKRYGRNALLRGLNYAEGATQRDRNRQIGGHKA